MDLKTWEEKGRYFKYGPHKIFYVDEGSGDNLLLVHGFPTSSWDWSQMWDELSKRYRVLALDMIGFGFSDKPRHHAYSIYDQADLIESLLSELQLGKVKILCHDYGDTVAQELLARVNKRSKSEDTIVNIESICFLNGGLFPEVHQPLLVQRLLMSPIGLLIGKFFNRQKLEKNFRKIFGPNTQPSEKELDEYWKVITHNNGKSIFHLLIRYMKERTDNRERWVGALQETTVPLRLIDGVYDPISGQHMADRYKELVPGADVVELEDIGHFPLIEAPVEVLKHYLEFEQSIQL